MEILLEIQVLVIIEHYQQKNKFTEGIEIERYRDRYSY